METKKLWVFLIFGIVLVHCEVEYHYIEKNMTWADAQQYCREHYTDLATLENAEDLHRLKIPYGAWAWIGLFDDPASWKGVMTSDSNSWRWSATGTTSPGGFQNWASGEPTNYYGNEHCVFIKNGLWGDHECARLFSFFCYTVQPSGTKDYILINTAMNLTSSQAYCRQHHHDLATIENSAENQAVTDLLPATTSFVWIGLYRTPWRWSDGSPSTYRSWSSGEPNNYANDEKCAQQLADNSWNDLPCYYKGHFICYKALKLSVQTKIRLQTTADLSDPAVRDKFLKVLESRLGVGFGASWIIPPAKEEKKKLNNVCPSNP